MFPETNCHPVVPYQAPVAKEGSSDIAGTLGSTLPMAAMFTRNKLIGWCVPISILSWDIS